MNIQVTKLFLVISISISGLSACKKDNCTAPDISENIIGVWEVDSSGDEVEFKADGTFIDENDAIVGTGTMSTNTYSITGDELEIIAVDASGTFTVTLGFSILKNECDEIKIIGGAGISPTLKRE
ncbi:MAG: hypothetical protein ACI8X3_002074 [Saprospiraceae bacterium]|jgi:hypothetical protein